MKTQIEYLADLQYAKLCALAKLPDNAISPNKVAAMVAVSVIRDTLPIKAPLTALMAIKEFLAANENNEEKLK